MEPGDGWIELGRAVERRRKELGLSLIEAAARTKEGGRRGFSDQTWSSIERGRRERRQGTLSDLCWALGWTEDSAERILAGGTPLERYEPPPRSPIEAALHEDMTITDAERRVFQAMLDLVEERKASGGL